jgi:Zn-dependent protease
MSGGMLYLLALIPAIILHELAHGYVAHLLGDDTAKRAGRLTLNPLKHIDPVGTIILPLVLAAGQLASIGHIEFMYGWAKPVPVNALNLRLNGRYDPRRLMAIVAAAGPAMNFALAILAGFAVHGAQSNGVLDFLAYFIEINLILGLFNLLPLPPMDGGRIAVGVLPLPLAIKLAGAEKFGIMLVLLGLFVLPTVLGQMGIAFDPFQEAMSRLLPWAERIVLIITGNQVGN